MHNFKITDYGLEVEVTQMLEPEAARRWKQQMREAIQKVDGPFGVLLDLTGVALAPEKAPEEIYQIIRDCRRAGLRRVSIMVASKSMQERSESYVRSGGLQEMARFFRADEDPDYEKEALSWVRRKE